MNKIDDLKEIYLQTEIPNDLEFRIAKTLKGVHMKNKFKGPKIFGIVAAASILIFAGTINLNNNVAMAMSEIPVLGKIVKVLTINFETIDAENVYAKVETSVIEGLTKEAIQETLNQKYFE